MTRTKEKFPTHTVVRLVADNPEDIKTLLTKYSKNRHRISTTLQPGMVVMDLAIPPVTVMRKKKK